MRYISSGVFRPNFDDILSRRKPSQGCRIVTCPYRRQRGPGASVNLSFHAGHSPPIIGRFKSAKVVLKPAAPGTGIIAGGPVRAVMEAAGVTDILSKSLGSDNSMNIVKAVFSGLENLLDARSVAKARGKPISEMWG